MQTALGGEAFDLLENGLLPGVETGFDGRQLFQIGLRLEGLGDFLFQIVDEPADLLGEGRPAAGRQRNGPRPEFVAEVVHETPVVRHRLGFREARGEVPDDGGFAGALGPRDEDVVAGAAHVQPEFDGLHRALLADHPIQGGQFRRVLKCELGGVADAAELGRRQFQAFGHRRLLLFKKRVSSL